MELDNRSSRNFNIKKTTFSLNRRINEKLLSFKVLIMFYRQVFYGHLTGGLSNRKLVELSKNGFKEVIEPTRLLVRYLLLRDPGLEVHLSHSMTVVQKSFTLT